jgi:hypothetical protein
MRILLLLICGLQTCEALACSCAQRFIEDEYAAVPIIVEAVAVSKERRGEDELVHLSVTKVWKTDGGVLDLLVRTPGAPCERAIGKGRRCIIFAERVSSFWSFLPWVKEPLWTSSCHRTIEAAVPEEWAGSTSLQARIDADRKYLDAQP